MKETMWIKDISVDKQNECKKIYE